MKIDDILTKDELKTLKDARKILKKLNKKNETLRKKYCKYEDGDYRLDRAIEEWDDFMMILHDKANVYFDDGGNGEVMICVN